MPLPMEAWKEDLLDTVPQDMPLGSDPQASPIGMTEEPDSPQGIEAILDTPGPSTGEVGLQLGQIHQVHHSDSVQNLTDIIIYAATLD